jgi:hypothetical protein
MYTDLYDAGQKLPNSNIFKKPKTQAEILSASGVIVGTILNNEGYVSILNLDIFDTTVFFYFFRPVLIGPKDFAIWPQVFAIWPQRFAILAPSLN